MDIFICTKPLQLIICIILNKKEFKNKLYIVDSFFDSKNLSTSLTLKKIFYEVVWFATKDEAFSAASINYPNNIYIDSDVGLLNLISLLKFKSKSYRTDIHVYEEGIGTYSCNLVAGKFKRLILKSIGAGCNFGGCGLTKKIHVFDKQHYINNNLGLSKKVIEIDTGLINWMEANINNIIEIFSPGYKVGVYSNKNTASIYISEWVLDLDLIHKIARKGNLYVKIHPHIKDKFEQIFSGELNVEFFPATLPAETAIIILLKSYAKVNIYHHNSSCVHYIKSDRVDYINLLSVMNTTQEEKNYNINAKETLQKSR